MSGFGKSGHIFHNKGNVLENFDQRKFYPQILAMPNIKYMCKYHKFTHGLSDL